MSKRNKKSAVVVEPQQPTEEMIKSVMDLYKPNKVEKFILKNFSELGGDRSHKVAKWFFPGIVGVAALGILYAIFGLEQAAGALFVTDSIVIIPLVTGKLYSEMKNSKRIRLLMNILGKSPSEIKELEKKYYLA